MSQIDTTPTGRPDPLIDEVRALREAVSAEAGHDVRKLAERLQQLERQYADRLVQPVDPAASSRKTRASR